MFNPVTLLALAAATIGASARLETARDTGLNGDTQCASGLCVAAVVNGTTVEYSLTYSNSQKLGWVAMGFGTQMSNAQIVLMWPNADGSVTLSQRTAPGHVMPTVDASPVRTASFSAPLSNVAASSPVFAFTIPANTDTKQSIIWAYSDTAPSSSAVDATIVQHSSMGGLTLDLTKSASSSSASGSGTSSSAAAKSTGSSGGYGSAGFTNTPYVPSILAVVAASLGFL